MPSVTQYRFRSPRPTKYPCSFSAGPSADSGTGAWSGVPDTSPVPGCNGAMTISLQRRPGSWAAPRCRAAPRFAAGQVSGPHRIPVISWRHTGGGLRKRSDDGPGCGYLCPFGQAKQGCFGSASRATRRSGVRGLLRETGRYLGEPVLVNPEGGHADADRVAIISTGRRTEPPSVEHRGSVTPPPAPSSVPHPPLDEPSQLTMHSSVCGLSGSRGSWHTAGRPDTVRSRAQPSIRLRRPLTGVLKWQRRDSARAT